MAVLAEAVDQIGPADRGFDCDDLSTRHGDIIGVVFAEMQEVAQHLPLNRRQIAIGAAVFVGGAVVVFVLVLVDSLFELRTQRTIAVSDANDFPESVADVGQQPAATLRVSGGG